MGSDLKTAWRLSFSDKSALEVHLYTTTRYNRRLTLPLPYLEHSN